MSATRPYRPGLDHLARLLMFVGLAILLAGFPLFSLEQGFQIWWLVAAFGLWILGTVAQRFSTPVPLETVSTPPGWPWMFLAIVVIPMLARWIDWHWPWAWLLIIFAVAVSGWASYLPEHRRQEIAKQYRSRDETVSADSAY